MLKISHSVLTLAIVRELATLQIYTRLNQDKIIREIMEMTNLVPCHKLYNPYAIRLVSISGINSFPNRKRPFD